MEIKTKDNQTIVLSDSIKRKWQREYQETLAEHVIVTDDGKEHFSISGVHKASEGMVLNLIQKIIVHDEHGVPSEVKPSREWLDDLDSEDFKLIEEHAIKLLKSGQDDAKK